GHKVEGQIAEIDQRCKIYLDKVPPEGEQAPEGGSDRPASRDRGDRGPRDRGERGHGDRGPSRGADRGPAGDGPAGDVEVGEDESGEGGDEQRRRRRLQRWTPGPTGTCWVGRRAVP